MTPNFKILLNVVQLNFGDEAVKALDKLYCPDEMPKSKPAYLADDWLEFQRIIDTHK